METIFTEGFYLNKVSENAPAFIITNQSIDVKKAIAWLTSHQHLADEKGYIRIVGKESKEGKRYFQVDTWKPKEEATSASMVKVTTIAPVGKGIDLAEFGTGEATDFSKIPF
jgi:hypothetical protein